MLLKYQHLSIVTQLTGEIKIEYFVLLQTVNKASVASFRQTHMN